jgi:ubiquinone/menaquinone biosynthesis C-methylase UbiE
MQPDHAAALASARKPPIPWDGLTATAYDRTYYDQHKAGGLDYAQTGRWQLDYAAWLRDAFGLRGKSMLDVGTACGAIAHGFTRCGVTATGIDLNEHTIHIGRVMQDVGDWPPAPGTADQPSRPTRLEICDAANLHLFGDASFNFIHSHQSAEHWPADLVPRILRELHRVARPGAKFFCVLDTTELAVRQRRDLAREDPTHVCIAPLRWWTLALSSNGWRVTTEEDRGRLNEHPLCYFEREDWDWFSAVRV